MTYAIKAKIHTETFANDAETLVFHADTIQSTKVSL